MNTNDTICPKCGETRTILKIRQALGVEHNVDVVKAAKAMYEECDRLASWITNVSNALGDRLPPPCAIHGLPFCYICPKVTT